jgi:hypothetical protein
MASALPGGCPKSHPKETPAAKRMKDVQTWLARQAQKEAKRSRFANALLTDKGWGYAAYRLRYLIWRVLLRAALHTVEVALFSSIFSMDFLAPVLIVRSATAIGISFWWGGLEQLRTTVRQHAAEKQWHRARTSIDAWMAMAVLFGVAIVGGSSTWILWTPDPRLGFSIFDAYAIAVIIRLALDMVARTFHSGMFALRRIYRPLWSLLIGDVLDVVGILLLWPLLGPWSFGPVLILVGALRTGLVFYFVRRAYANSRIPPSPPGLRNVKALGSLKRSDLAGLFKHGLANSASQIDALLILALVAASLKSREYMVLAILFYVIRPFIGAGYSWARMFYFDFKSLSLRYSRFFAIRFERFLRRVALVFAGVMAALATAWTLVFWIGGGLDWTFSILLPFFFARSVFGLYQVQAFSFGCYRYLLKTSGALALVILALGLLPHSRMTVMIVITLAMVLVVLIAGHPKNNPERQEETNGEKPVSLPRWITLLTKVGAPVRISTAYVNTTLCTTHRLVSKLVDTTDDNVVVTRFGHKLVLWFETPNGEPLLTPEKVAVITGGCLWQLRQGVREKNGLTAFSNSLSNKLMGNDLSRILSNPRSRDLSADELKGEFNRRFPTGRIVDSRSGNLTHNDFNKQSVVVREVLGEIDRVSKGVSPSRYHTQSLDVSVYCPNGEPELVFLVNCEENKKERVRWRRLVQSATLVHSIASGKKLAIQTAP